MKHYHFLILSLLMLSSCAVQKNGALEDSVLFSIDGKPTIAEEFIYVYEKNNFNNDRLYYEEDVDEYFGLFVNFKLKVEAAKVAGIDTSKAFLEEFKSYKNQLIKPYLSETKEQQRLVEEAYEHMKYEIDASHILISVDENANPEDTAAAYLKISEIHEKAKAGEDFGALAVAYSQDPSAKNNQGRLGYFTAFQMVFAFEEAAYTTPVDSVSDILRSRFGYHILKVHDRKPYSGKVKVSHIMLTDQNGTVDENTLRNNIFEIHDQLVAGTDWDELCRKYSDDQRTKSNSGTLPFIGLRQINDEAFENVAFNLENPGEISDPVKSRFGWHIIRLEEKQGLQPFDELKEELEQKVSVGDRLRLSKKAVIARLKEQNHFVQSKENRDLFIALADSLLLQGKWNPTVSDSIGGLVIFSIEQEPFSARKCIDGIQPNLRRRTDIKPRQYLRELLDTFVEQTLLAHEEQRLIASNRDFSLLLTEYYEGILLFDIMNQKVWEKAVEDTLGLQSYFEMHKDSYTWGSRANAYVCASSDQNVLDQVKDEINDLNYTLMEITLKPETEVMNHPEIESLVQAFKQYKLSTITIACSGQATAAQQYFKNLGIPDSTILLVTIPDENIIRVKVNSKSKKSLEYLYNQESALTLSVEEGLYEKGDNQAIDAVPWEIGMQEFEENGNFYLVVIRDVLAPASKKFSEVKGTVISDYQNYLEKAWIKDLKGTFRVDINNNTLEQIKTQFKKKLRSSD
jgi:peptidyl-prolyl cis-trans isomerase SurA